MDARLIVTAFCLFAACGTAGEAPRASERTPSSPAAGAGGSPASGAGGVPGSGGAAGASPAQPAGGVSGSGGAQPAGGTGGAAPVQPSSGGGAGSSSSAPDGGAPARDGGQPAAADAARRPETAGATDGGALAAPDLAAALATRPETWARLPGFPEGPSHRADGSVLLCAPSLMRVAPDKKRYRVLPFNCLGSVGLGDGSLLVTGQMGLFHVRTDGTVALLAAAPNANDLTVDRDGNVYFTADGGVHRLTPTGRHEPLATGLAANGIEVDPANRYLYIAQASRNLISRFELPTAGGPLGPPAAHLTAVPVPDGLAFDAQGRLWAALHQVRKIGVFDVEARRELGRLDVPVQTTVQNLAFGGPDNEVLFVVGGNFDANALLLRYDLRIAGFRTNPGAPAYVPARSLTERVNETPF